MQLLCVMLSDECQLSLLSKLMSTIVNKAAKTTRAANMDAKRYEVCQPQLLTSSGAREPFCNGGPPRSKIKFYHVTWDIDCHPVPWIRADC